MKQEACVNLSTQENNIHTMFMLPKFDVGESYIPQIC